jgi:hypothetical protein
MQPDFQKKIYFEKRHNPCPAFARPLTCGVAGVCGREDK